MFVMKCGFFYLCCALCMRSERKGERNLLLQKLKNTACRVTRIMVSSSIIPVRW
jgi:hypothetical protein